MGSIYCFNKQGKLEYVHSISGDIYQSIEHIDGDTFAVVQRVGSDLTYNLYISTLNKTGYTRNTKIGAGNAFVYPRGMGFDGMYLLSDMVKTSVPQYTGYWGIDTETGRNQWGKWWTTKTRGAAWDGMFWYTILKSDTGNDKIQQRSIDNENRNIHIEKEYTIPTQNSKDITFDGMSFWICTTDAYIVKMSRKMKVDKIYSIATNVYKGITTDGNKLYLIA